MDANKLENIISGYGINADDAAWLRALAPPAAAVPVNRNTLDHVARLLELSDHHLTNGPHPIERRITYWRAQAAVAIGGVNELAAANKENNNG